MADIDTIRIDLAESLTNNETTEVRYWLLAKLDSTGGFKIATTADDGSVYGVVRRNNLTNAVDKYDSAVTPGYAQPERNSTIVRKGRVKCIVYNGDATTRGSAIAISATTNGGIKTFASGDQYLGIALEAVTGTAAGLECEVELDVVTALVGSA